jgi:GT2 family glycosyltransferase
LVLVENDGSACGGAVDLGGVEAKVLRPPRPMGFAEVNNFALRHIEFDTEAVCFLNQDTVTRQAWLHACLDCLEADATLGAVMPLIENYDGTGWDEAFLTCAKASPGLYAALQQGVGACVEHLPPFIAVPEITAAAMVVRTEALVKAGPFDPIYGSYYEDYDLCRRISAVGYKVGICTRGRVGHYGGSVTTDQRAYLRRARWIARNRVIYAARWKWGNRPWGLVRYFAVELPRNLARSALGRSNIPLRAFLHAQLDLLRQAPRLASARRDQRQWHNYLKNLGWPESQAPSA